MTQGKATRDPKGAAKVYRRMGLNPIPIKKNSKEPALPKLAPYLQRPATEEEFASWEFPAVAIVTGPVSDIVVVDADGPKGVALLEEHGHPGTPMARTPRGGLHVYCRCPDAGMPTKIRIAPELDLKAAGGYVLAPPSKGYEWIISPEEAAPGELPQWILEKARQGTRNGPAHPVGERIPRGKRNREMTSLGGTMRRRGMEEDEIFASLCAVNEKRCDPPLEVEEVRKIARSVARYEPTAREATPHVNNGQRPATTQGVGSGENVGIIKRLGDTILEDNHFAQDAGGKLYRFSEGVYKQYGERFIRQRVLSLLEEWGETKQWSSHRANETVEFIRVKSPELWEKPPIDEVNVLNGILNVVTKELREHSPDFLSTAQLPVAYDEKATCPAWDKFVSETFPEDAQGLAFEIPADLMTPERSSQKALLAIGEGANGKSTYLEAVERFVGSTNIAGLSLHKLETDRFSVSRLVGKLANICPDLPSTHLTETSMFKALTGGDRVNAEYKYRESFEFAPYARLVFSANQVPRCEDASYAFFRRWLVVPFDKTFEEDEQIPREVLDAKLSDPKELSGVLNKALEALPKLRREGFTESKSMKEAWAEFRAMTDPVSVWLDKATVEHADATVQKTELHAAYLSYCDAEGRAGMTSRAFGRALKRVRPTILETQVTHLGKRVWAWLGIGLKPSSPPPDSDEHVPPAERHAAPNARNARNSTNCFLDEASSDNTDDKEEEHIEITNKENFVHSVQSVHKGGERQDQRVNQVVDALEDATTGPGRTLALYKEGGIKDFQAVVSAVAAHFGDEAHWRAWIEPVHKAIEATEGE